MKRIISIVMLLAVLFTFASCGKKQTTTEVPVAENATAATLDTSSPEAMFGHIDQSQPVDGYYKLWNKDGLKQLAAHPDGQFQLLCSIDGQGMELAPIAEFTGSLDGQNHTISNVTIQGGDKDFGFVGVNKGKISNLYLDQITYQPSGATNMGSLAGRNEGTILRCVITGSTLTVENAAEGASCGALVGTNTGDLINNELEVDVIFHAPQKASVGGIVGKVEGGKLENLDMTGCLTITGENKTVGLLAGEAKNAVLESCAFVGADNSLNGKLFINYFGTQENVTGGTWLWRDNSREPEQPHIQQKREKVVQAMYEMCTIEWHPENLAHTCNCSLNMCNGMYDTTYTYYGLPYNHKNGSLARMKYCMNEDGTLKDWVYEMGQEGTFDTFDMYIGNDCSSCVQQAWLTVSNTVDSKRSSFQAPAVAQMHNTGIVPLGQWEWDLGLDLTSEAKVTKNYTEHNGPEVMYDAYALLRMGDGVVFFYESGHTRMCSSDAVVVRDENGKISGEYSYVLMHEQGAAMVDEEKKTYTTCRTDWKCTFDNLYSGYYLPITIQEFVTGEFAEPTCTLEGGSGENNRFALTTGVVKANFSLDYVIMTITDSEGNVIFDHWMFPTVAKRLDNNSNDYRIRTVIMEYDLAGFAVPLKSVGFQSGETYHAVVTGNLTTGDSYTVLDFSFTY